jgi:hypothetical protein
VDVIRLNSQFQNGPAMLSSYLANDLFQAIPNRPNENLPPSLGTPDHVVDHEMYIAPFMLIVHVYSIAQ